MYKRRLTLLATLLAVVVALGEEKPSGTPKSTAVSGFARIKLKVKGQWMSLEDLREAAYAALNDKGLTPPCDLKPVFDFMPGEKVFLRVSFGRRIGKQSWYVEFDRDGKVLDAKSVLVRG